MTIDNDIELARVSQEKFARRGDWNEFIQRDNINWDWFGTLTFRDYKSTYSAKRYFWKWLRIVNKARFGSVAGHQDLSVSWVLGEERQARGAIHYHVLVSNVEYLMRKQMGKAWWDVTKGYGKILPFKGSAVNYITKYIAKDGNLDIDIRAESGARVYGKLKPVDNFVPCGSENTFQRIKTQAGLEVYLDNEDYFKTRQRPNPDDLVGYTKAEEGRRTA